MLQPKPESKKRVRENKSIPVVMWNTRNVTGSLAGVLVERAGDTSGNEGGEVQWPTTQIRAKCGLGKKRENPHTRSTRKAHEKQRDCFFRVVF